MIPSTYPTKLEKENHLQKGLGREYLSSQEGMASRFFFPWVMCLQVNLGECELKVLVGMSVA